VKPTLKTVADAVGVSRSSVSNAYSRPDQLSAELRDKIFEAARQLGYTGPHPVARTLRRGRVGAIGVLFTDKLSAAFTDPYAVEFLRGLAQTAEQHATSLVLIPLPARDRMAGLDALKDAVVDGFCVFCVPDWHVLMGEAQRRGLPVVTEFPPDDDPTVMTVGIDDRRAAAEAGDAHRAARPPADRIHRRRADRRGPDRSGDARPTGAGVVPPEPATVAGHPRWGGRAGH
jgi:DNA-binding LacI/PurR family transcriptional regulator